MRVLMLGWEFPPHNSGGLGVACQGLARALLHERADVLFVLPKHVSVSDPSLRFLFADTSRAKVRRVDTALSPYVTSEQYARYRARLGSDIYGQDLFSEVARYAYAIADIAENETFDVIHAHDWLSFLAGIEAKRVSGKPLIAHVHATGFDLAGGESVDGRTYAIEKAGLEAADVVIAVSQFTKDILVKRYGVNPDKVEVVHNGIHADQRHETAATPQPALKIKRPGHKMVLYVGRMSMHKGPDYFLRAAKRVLEYYPKVVFVMSGSGDMEWQLIKQATDMGIADKVFFTGFTRDGELARLYTEADLFVLPSVSEPFGLTPLESLINGTPVLISKQSGVSEVLRHALKVDFWDTDEMANQIIATLQNKPLHDQLAVYGREETRALTWQRAAQKCINVYRKLVHIFLQKVTHA